MNTTIDTQVFISLINGDPEQAIQQKQANAVLAKLAENSDVVWVIHKNQLKELLAKTREIVSGGELRGEDQENAEEFLNYLAGLELELTLGTASGKRILYGDPDADDSATTRKATKAVELAEALLKENPSGWENERTDAIIVCHAMLEKAILLSSDKKHVAPMVEKLNELQNETFPPPWLKGLREFKRFPFLKDPKDLHFKRPEKKKPQEVLEALSLG